MPSTDEDTRWNPHRELIEQTAAAIASEAFVSQFEIRESSMTFSQLFAEQWDGVIQDHQHFYSKESLGQIAGGFAVGALMANSGFDEHAVRHKYLENVVNISEDEFYELIHQPHFLGDGRYTLPLFALAALSEPILDRLPLTIETAEWGQRSLRAVVVGAPPMLLSQIMTGASRPGETGDKSNWKPFRDNNGVSGHSFMGAVPFITAAHMTDNGWLKAGLYVLSTAPAVSRVNDDKHYFSQAFLGWWIAYLAASAVDRTHDDNEQFRWTAAPVGRGLGVQLLFQH